ncbi:tetratricopeptide repeat protein [Gigaspora margarita]|uniref:Tetratricopeptide repeat protein n=1 Tax=Gigaspora margarita TaxID=4874 RepID=A0A8H4AVQ8_GIGMA|nr:tetratricopeptide repeat protein [Gigaspora margarita]
MLKRYHESLVELNKSIGFEPNDASALSFRGQTYYMLNQCVKVLGYSCFNLNKYEESRENLTKVLEVDSDNAVTLRILGQTYYELGMYNESHKSLTRSLEIGPKNLDALRTRGLTYYMLGRFA